MAPTLQRGRKEMLTTWTSARAQTGEGEQRRSEDTVGRSIGPFSFLFELDAPVVTFSESMPGGNQLLVESSHCNEVRGQKATEGTDSPISRDPRQQCKVKLG